MSDLETRACFPGNFEIRRRGGGGRSFSGRFPYRKRATIRDRGRVRKEVFMPHSLSYSITGENAGQQGRDVLLLAGHKPEYPLARKNNGTLLLTDSDVELSFIANLPKNEDLWPSWMRDIFNAVETGLVTGISPGFRIPPKATVPNAVKTVPEKGNPGVYERHIYEALLTELSIVTFPAYKATSVDIRQDELSRDKDLKRYEELAAWL